VLLVPRHGFDHSIPSHRLRTKGHLLLARDRRAAIVALSSVGSLRGDIGPGSWVVPDDFIDCTFARDRTFFHDRAVHVDFSRPFSQPVRDVLLQVTRQSDTNVIDGGVYVCIEGPRYNTPAEGRMYRNLGGDVIGMSAATEAILAKELGEHYGLLTVATNSAYEGFEVIDSMAILESVWSVRFDVELFLRRIAEELQAACFPRPTESEQAHYVNEVLHSLARSRGARGLVSVANY
jgi:purine nucleoside phosphorylase